jgi:hypothetical protein
VSAVVEANGATVPASYDSASGRWVATVATGAAVTIPAGGIRDSYGETNGAAGPF